MNIQEKISGGKTFLGIEFGSTRIKAVLTDETFAPIASGSHSWENRFENGYWTYSLDDIRTGMQDCYASLVSDIKEKYGVVPGTFGAMGISAMMHGYMPFDENDELLVPFRTWRNTSTEKAASELSSLLGFNMPQRWTISHLCQAVLDNEPHVPQIMRVSTLAVYIHYLLTGSFTAGLGEASGIFPIDGKGYDTAMVTKTNDYLRVHGFDKDILSLFPKCAPAGQKGDTLTEKGALLLDPTGNLKAGVPLCPPEGDAGTGMAAANAVAPGTGNISAGTSVFSMLILDKPLKGYYPEIDVVASPDGSAAAMVHCNNCCGELDAWVGVFREFAELTGANTDASYLYETLYRRAMTADADCGGVTAYNYLSAEPVSDVSRGAPMCFRPQGAKLTLAGLMRAQLNASLAALRLGMDILFEKENIRAEQFTCHGGLFKIKGAADRIAADALNTPVTVMETAGEGGAWGMSLLAAYMICGGGDTLGKWLADNVFADIEAVRSVPDEEGRAGFNRYMERYTAGLRGERLLEEVE